MVRIFIQARMSSSRFPGKVLAPFLGKPLVAHVIERAQQAVAKDRIVLLTSRETSDDPLAHYAEDALGIPVYRGELENVFARFQDGLKRYPCDWFVRICADSPVIDGELIAHMIGLASENFDIVTNVAYRTFPPGQSVEIVRTAPFLSIDRLAQNADEIEHVTRPYYSETSPYRMLKVVSRNPALSATRMVVDSVEDLKSLEISIKSGDGNTLKFARLAECQA